MIGNVTTTLPPTARETETLQLMPCVHASLHDKLDVQMTGAQFISAMELVSYLKSISHWRAEQNIKYQLLTWEKKL
jgi:hypothetical protein